MKRMNTKILVSAVVATLIVVIACSKNTYNTKPTLKVKTLSSIEVNNGDVLTVQLQVTDKEGDVTDTLFMRRVRLNKKPTAASNRLTDSFHLKVPDAANFSDAVIQLDLKYNDYLVDAINPTENDTITFRFALKDKAGNVSDTITTDPIVVIRQ